MTYRVDNSWAAIWWFAAHGNRAFVGSNCWRRSMERRGPAIRAGSRPGRRRGARIGLIGLVACGLAGSILQSQSQTPKADTAAAPAQKAPPLKVRYETDDLPSAVVDLRETLLAAIEAGQIEELRQAYDMSAVKPDIGAPPKTD